MFVTAVLSLFTASCVSTAPQPAALPACALRIAGLTTADDRVTVAFTYTPPAPVRSVAVAGQFNGWNGSANPMTRQPDGSWTTSLDLDPGVYQYKFVVNGDKWTLDPNAPARDDGNGNTNSVVSVVPPAYHSQPGVLGDGLITGSAVQHAIAPAYVKRVDDARLALVLRTRRNDVQECRIEVQGPADGAATAMTRYAADDLYDYWRGVVRLAGQERLRYRFLVRDGSTSATYGTDGYRPASQGASAWFTLNLKQFPALHTPEWARDAVFYQIFPDRFANGDPSNDPPNVQPWGSPPTYNNWMGGDLQGVIGHLGHLADLGVNAIYLNPIFKTSANHGYETVDYHEVDPRFGTNATLSQLVTDAHGRHFHVILDGVFALTGVSFFPFKSLREQGEASPYRDWYFIHSFPIEVKQGETSYTAYFGFPSMPKLNVLNPDTHDYILDVGTRWIRGAGIDGWRLDSADQVPHEFWRDFRKAVRAARPDAYIVGEIWPNASAWLQGDQFDSVMNYRWRGAALDFFAGDKTTPGQFDHSLAEIRDDYPIAATNVMFNMLDSHDTERLINSCGGNVAKERQAVLFQMTYPGTPCVYYGDEVGMEGGHDPDDRRAMIWDASRWNQPLYAYFKQVIHLRAAHPALRRGEYKTVLTDDRTGAFAFTRTLGAERVLVVFNRSDSPSQLHLPASAAAGLATRDWLTGASLTAAGAGYTVALPARGYAVFGTR